MLACGGLTDPMNHQKLLPNLHVFPNTGTLHEHSNKCLYLLSHHKKVTRTETIQKWGEVGAHNDFETRQWLLLVVFAWVA